MTLAAHLVMKELTHSVLHLKAMTLSVAFGEKDLAGRAIDTKTILPDGSAIQGLSGLRNYLLEKKLDDFIGQFCRKLLGYALGRELKLSDEPLILSLIHI